MASPERSMPFIKNLASSDRKTRTAALLSLRTFLSSPAIATKLTTLDTLKLWKGLFFALWMSDRPLPQQALCADLAELIWILPSSASASTKGKKAVVDEVVVVRWLTAFWATMAREWTTGIDVLRMDKFLLLVRRVLGASFVWMQQQQAATPKSAVSKKRTAAGKDKKPSAATTRFDAQRVEAVLALLGDWPFRAEEELKRDDEDDEDDEEENEDDGLMPRIVPVGLRLHVIDIWVDEAEKAGLLVEGDGEEAEAKDSSSLSGRAVLTRINDLVVALHAKTLSKAVRIRSQEALKDVRLPWVEEVVEEEAEGGDGEWAGFGN